MTIILPLAFISPQVLLLLAVVPLSVATGFALGLLYERWYHFSAVQRMTKRFEKLFQAVSKSLEKAEKACQIFNAHPQSGSLNSKQRAAMRALTAKLSEELKQMARACQVLPAERDSAKLHKASSGSETETKKLKPFLLPKWELAPVDQRTDFPDATAYQSNLQSLFSAMQQTSTNSAVLFLKLDHYSRHASRYGSDTADAFLKKAGAILLRKLREEDFLAQITEDLLIAILPDVQNKAMEEIANRARKAIRSHRFINPESEQEVFVTASFSYTIFSEKVARNNDPQQELWDRCQNALAASQKQGRCQLHEMTDLGISRLIAG